MINNANDANLVLQDFLSEVNRTAVSGGVLADPITGSVGVIDGDQLYQIVDTLEKIHGKVYLTAYAMENTTSMGPLRLKIKVMQKVGV